jgi:hypothetical protein
MKLPKSINKIDEIQDDLIDKLGTRDEVVSILIKIFPDGDFTDPTWGVLDRDGYSIEFNISEEHDITSFMLHVRGDNRSLEAIELIHNKTGWRPMDEELIDFNGDPGKGLSQWKNAREQVLVSIKIKKKWWEFWRH